jgi:hypothetical protein
MGKAKQIAKKTAGIASVLAASAILLLSFLALLLSACFGMLEGDVAGMIGKSLVWLATWGLGPFILLVIAAVVLLKEKPKPEPPDRKFL